MSMNGAESLVHTLLACGVDTCFANPGTSEMHFVAALDRIPGMRCVLGLFEGVVTGAADGYARMADKPAATLLHCGPGLANGLANLHNARRANTMMVNCVGDQATYHRPLDAPLTADTEGFARGVSGWVRTASHAETCRRGRRRGGAGRVHRRRPDRHADPALRHVLEPRRRRSRTAAAPRAPHRQPACHPGSRAAAALRRARAHPPRQQRPARRPAGGRPPHRRRHRRPPAGPRLERPHRARARPLRHRPRALCHRPRRQRPCRHHPPDPGRRHQAGRLLRLSRQARLSVAARRHMCT